MREHRAHLREADVTRFHAEALVRSIARGVIGAAVIALPIVVANELNGSTASITAALFVGGVPTFLVLRALAGRSDRRLAAKVVAVASERKRAALEA